MEMHVYVVVCDSAYGEQVERVFISESKADAYLAERQKEQPYYCFSIKKYWAI